MKLSETFDDSCENFKSIVFRLSTQSRSHVLNRFPFMGRCANIPKHLCFKKSNKQNKKHPVCCLSSTANLE